MKDAVSIPGVSLHYLLRGCVERGADLYSPCKEAYEMLKEAVVGGPSLVFTRYHEVGVTKIRSHRIAEPRFCKNIVGYDANALYLSTMLRDMPCGKGSVVHYNNEAAAPILTQRLKEEKWFGFAEVDIQYVAQFSYGPSFRTKRTLFDYFRRSFKSSSTEEFQK